MRWLLTALAAVLYAAGWLTYKIWFALAWCGAAIRVGWQEAHSRPK